MTIIQYSPNKLQQALQAQQPLTLLDVREAHEFAYAHIDGSLHIPLAQLPSRVAELDPEQDIVVICHHGVRSQQACLFLEQAGFKQLFNLLGGIDAWSLSCDSSIKRY